MAVCLSPESELQSIVQLIVRPNLIPQMIAVVCRALTLLYNRLKINLPRLVQELEINEEFSEQVLLTDRLAYDSVCEIVFSSEWGRSFFTMTVSL